MGPQSISGSPPGHPQDRRGNDVKSKDPTMKWWGQRPVKLLTAKVHAVQFESRHPSTFGPSSDHSVYTLVCAMAAQNSKSKVGKTVLPVESTAVKATCKGKQADGKQCKVKGNKAVGKQRELKAKGKKVGGKQRELKAKGKKVGGKRMGKGKSVNSKPEHLTADKMFNFNFFGGRSVVNLVSRHYAKKAAWM
jgi:hypothetical protein